MSNFLNLNDPNYPSFETEPSDQESHDEPSDESIKTNVKDYEHPLFSETGPPQTAP